MPLNHHDQEIVAVAISVAIGCRPCTSHHLREARRAGAGQSILDKAVAAAVCVRTSATDGIRRHALGDSPETEACGCAASESLMELASLGASLAVNCTSNIARHLAAARDLGVSEDHVAEVLALVRKIRAVGIGHAERLVAEVPLPEGACARVSGCC